MSETEYRLADLSTWDWLSRGGYRAKRWFFAVCVALDTVLTILCAVLISTRAAAELTTILLMLLIIIGVPALIASAVLFAHSERVRSSIKSLSDPADALADLSSKPILDRNTPIFGERYACFFRAGSVAEYAQIVQLEHSEYKQIDRAGDRTIYRLYAKRRDGTYLPLHILRVIIARQSSGRFLSSHADAKRRLQETVRELRQRIPDLPVKKI